MSRRISWGRLSGRFPCVDRSACKEDSRGRLRRRCTSIYRVFRYLGISCPRYYSAIQKCNYLQTIIVFLFLFLISRQHNCGFDFKNVLSIFNCIAFLHFLQLHRRLERRKLGPQRLSKKQFSTIDGNYSTIEVSEKRRGTQTKPPLRA